MTTNDLSTALPTLIGNFQDVLREHVGFIPSVNQGFDMQRAAVGTSVTIPTVPTLASVTLTAGLTEPEGTAITTASRTHTLTKMKGVPFKITSEELRALRENREGYKSKVIMQAIRTLVNEIETDTAIAAAVGASRAAGTAGTTPFGSTLDVLSAVDKILNVNGVAPADRHLVMDFDAKEKMGNLTTLLDASAYGTSEMVREGKIGRAKGFDLHYSANVSNAAKGTGSGYVVNGAGHEVGDTSIVLKTGSNPILAGDVIKFENSAHLYVVKTGISAPGTIVLQEPGLLEDVADDDTVTVQATSMRNMAFTRDAIALSVRPIERQSEDRATEVILISDPDSGLTFELAYYPEFLQGTWILSAVWGVDNIHPEKTAILLG